MNWVCRSHDKRSGALTRSYFQGLLAMPRRPFASPGNALTLRDARMVKESDLHES
jgi:hypothetical protein